MRVYACVCVCVCVSLSHTTRKETGGNAYNFSRTGHKGILVSNLGGSNHTRARARAVAAPAISSRRRRGHFSHSGPTLSGCITRFISAYPAARGGTAHTSDRYARPNRIDRNSRPAGRSVGRPGPAPVTMCRAKTIAIVGQLRILAAGVGVPGPSDMRGSTVGSREGGRLGRAEKWGRESKSMRRFS